MIRLKAYRLWLSRSCIWWCNITVHDAAFSMLYKCRNLYRCLCY